MKANCLASDREVLDKNTGIETFEEGVDQKGEKIYYQVYKFPVGSHNKNRLIGGLAVNITGTGKRQNGNNKRKKPVSVIHGKCTGIGLDY